MAGHPPDLGGRVLLESTVQNGKDLSCGSGGIPRITTPPFVNFARLHSKTKLTLYETMRRLKGISKLKIYILEDFKNVDASHQYLVNGQFLR